MFSLLQNNFVVSALVSLILTFFIVSQDRNKEDKHGILFYLRYFALNFILVLVVLYFKTGDLSLPSLQQTGGSPFNPTSTTTAIPTPSTSIQTGGLSQNVGNDIGSQLGLSRVDLGNTPF